MADLPERDLSWLLDMLLSAQDAEKFTHGMNKAEFLDSDLHQSAVIRALEVLGEAAGRVSRETVNALPEIPWQDVTGMRHRLIHDYFDVDLELVWEEPLSWTQTAMVQTISYTESPRSPRIGCSWRASTTMGRS